MLFSILSTFLIVVIAWIFFRAETITDAFLYIKTIASPSLLSMPNIPRSGALLLLLYMCFEWMQRHREHVLDIAFVKYKVARYAIYYGLIAIILIHAGDLQPFIYFQF